MGGAISIITYWPQYFIRRYKEKQIEKEKIERMNKRKATCLQILDTQYLNNLRDNLSSSITGLINGIADPQLAKVKQMLINDLWAHYDSLLNNIISRQTLIQPYYDEIIGEDNLYLKIRVEKIINLRDYPDNTISEILRKYGIPNLDMLISNWNVAIAEVEEISNRISNLS